MKGQKNIIAVLGLIILINVLAHWFPVRKDLTADARYTLSETTESIVEPIDKPLWIKVYLKGDFPLDFKRLGQAVKAHLEELRAVNKRIKFAFVNPSGMEEELIKQGMEPSQLTVEQDGEVSQKLIFPYALVKMGAKTQVVNLLTPSGDTQDDQLQRAIENIEFAFSDAISRLLQDKKQSLAVLRSHGTLEDIYLYDFLSGLKSKYNLAPFTLRPESLNQQQVLDDLKKYNGLIVAKPTTAFSEDDKYIIDQYIMQGGKALWMLDYTTASMDSLQRDGSSLIIPRDLNLTDLLFSYGVRVNHNLVEDLYSSKIALATGNVGGKTQFSNLLWYYFPVILNQNNNPISKNLQPIRLKFTSTIDTLLSPDIVKTPLLQTSKLTKVKGTPLVIDLSEISQKVQPELFRSGTQLAGVLLEGRFPSAYAYRTKPFETQHLNKSDAHKMIVIADGDIAANQIQGGQPTLLDIDKWTGQTFGNKEFLLNAVNYLMGDSDLLNIRRKTLKLTMLNKETLARQKTLWQWVNVGLPLLILGLFGLVYTLIRRKKYM